MQLSTAFKSRLVRTCWEHCSENGLVPMVGVIEGGASRVPPGHAREGMVSFNIGASAVRALEFTDDWITFDARFNGVVSSVALHVEEVTWAGSPEGGCFVGFPARRVSEGNGNGSAGKPEVSESDEAADAEAVARREKLRLI